MEKARKEQVDILIIDTAGRLQNRTELMDELGKIVRVIRKLDDTAPHVIYRARECVGRVSTYHPDICALGPSVGGFSQGSHRRCMHRYVLHDLQ